VEGKCPLALSVECCFVGGSGSGQRTTARGGGWGEREAAAFFLFSRGWRCVRGPAPVLPLWGRGMGREQETTNTATSYSWARPLSTEVRLSSVATVVTSNDEQRFRDVFFGCRPPFFSLLVLYSRVEEVDPSKDTLTVPYFRIQIRIFVLSFDSHQSNKL
jgi:hypothetical protein